MGSVLVWCVILVSCGLSTGVVCGILVSCVLSTEEAWWPGELWVKY